jgi:HD-GYP domain-containing protein (c-di-GMP phosphodiesterase class II)
MDLVYDEISVNGPQPPELAMAKDLIKKTQDIVRSMPDLQVLVNEFFAERESLKQHALLSCLFTSVICQNVEWISPKLVEEICLGAFLQNIGLARIKTESFEVSPDMTEDEKEIFHKHPISGYRFLQYYPVSEKVRQIVLQHHESCDGKGYPFGLRLTKIYPPAKIVHISSEFSALMLNNNFQPKEALTHLLQSIGFREKYDPEMLRSLIKGFVKKK